MLFQLGLLRSYFETACPYRWKRTIQIGWEHVPVASIVTSHAYYPSCSCVSATWLFLHLTYVILLTIVHLAHSPWIFREIFSLFTFPPQDSNLWVAHLMLTQNNMATAEQLAQDSNYNSFPWCTCTYCDFRSHLCFTCWASFISESKSTAHGSNLWSLLWESSSKYFCVRRNCCASWVTLGFGHLKELAADRWHLHLEMWQNRLCFVGSSNWVDPGYLSFGPES